MKIPEHVVVLGAGPGGLACAHELARHGIRSTVLERNDAVGGLCRTVAHDGYRFDQGCHRWFTKNEDLHRWFLGLMDGELVEVDRISRIVHSNRMFDYPISAGDLIRKSRPAEIVGILAGFGRAKAARLFSRDTPVNMEDAFVSQFGRPLYEMFFETYSEKVWGRPCRELSADWVAQRSAGLSVIDIVRGALAKSTRRHGSLVERFVYPRLGYGRIPERLAEDVAAAGSEIRVATPVSRVRLLADDTFEIDCGVDEYTETVSGDAVVSTIPLGALARMLEPCVDEHALACADALAFRDLVIVTLLLNVPRVSRDSWVYVQDRDILFGRFHEPANWSDALVPDADHTSLVLECFCSRGDGTWQMSDAEITERCVGDLADKLAFIDRRRVVGSVVIRIPNAYPVYDLDYARKLAVINDALGAFPGLHTVGRGGTFRYNNTDHSIEMGLLCAHRIAGLGVDHMGVNTEQEYHEVRSRHAPGRDRYHASHHTTADGSPQ